MIEYNLGVSVESVYTITKKIDTDFFSEKTTELSEEICMTIQRIANDDERVRHHPNHSGGASGLVRDPGSKRRIHRGQSGETVFLCV